MANKLPEKLTLLRKHYGYSQGDIANKLHIPVTEYMNWENGNTICGIQQLKVLADLFHVSLDAMADNAKDIVIAEDNLGDSVNIPFLNGQNPSMTQQMDVADNMMPVSSVLPSDTQEQTLKVSALSEDNLGATKQMGTVPPETKQKPKADPKTDNTKKKNKKKKTMYLVAGICAAAVVLAVVLIIVLRSNGGTVAVGTVNRIAEGDKYTLYVDNKGALKTSGQFSSSDFKDLVQVSAYGSHAVGLTNKGKVVTTDNDSAVAEWSNITMVAAGKDHTVGLEKNGTVQCSGNSNACAVSDWTDITAVYAGNGVTVGLRKDGSLATSGSINSAIGNQSDVVSVSISDDFLSVTKKDGTVSSYAIGSKPVISTSGFSKVVSTASCSSAIVGVQSDGKVAIATSNNDLAKAVTGWTNIKYVAAYGNTIVGVDNSGKIYGAGDNTYNQYDTSGTATASASAGTKLATPQNIKTDLTTANLSIKWDTVENATYYKVNVTGMDEIKAASNSTSIPTTSLENGKEYTITVVACSDKPETHPNSDEGKITYTYQTLSKKLDAPSNIAGYAYYNVDKNEFIVTWNAVENADFYNVSIQGGPDQQFTTNKAEISLDHTSITDSTTSINVSVTAGSNSTAYTTSDTTKVTLPYKVSKQNITITYSTKDGAYKSSAVSLQLAYGVYKASAYLPTDTKNQGYVLENTDETFEVKSNTTTFNSIVIKSGIVGD